MSKNPIPKKHEPHQADDSAMERMNKALKAALETPPRKHADEPTRRIREQKSGMTSDKTK
jgi:hypothetical protein